GEARHVDGEGGGVAGHAARRIGDDHGELGATVCGRRRRRGVGHRRRPADGHAVLLPLIVERGGTGGGHREGRGLAGGDGLAGRLGGDGGGHGRGVDGEGGGGAGHTARRIGDDHGELGATVRGGCRWRGVV